MRLRHRIFRQFIALALIPSLIVAAAAYFLLDRAIDQATRQLTPEAPDRTINSLRLSEARLQQMVESLLSASDIGNNLNDSLLDWRLVVDHRKIVSLHVKNDRSIGSDSLFFAGELHPGSIRRMVQKRLILGAAVEKSGLIIAGGFIFDSEYLSGFDAAASSLSQSRSFQNILPGFVMFITATGAVVVVTVVIIAFLLSRRLSRLVTRPLERLTEMTSAVARGERPQAAAVAGSDEIVRLADSFQKMMADLDDSRARLMAAQRVAAWQEFARRMAHELKNPLTPISLSLYRIEKKLSESGRYEEFREPFEAITAEVEHLQRMAADYASLAHLPSPKVTNFDFNRLARELLELYAVQLESFRLENLVGAPSFDISGDPDRLREAMVNIIKNALEFTPSGGVITIATGRTGAAVYFAVTNDNKEDSIDESSLRQATMPYFTTRPGGVGLGLAIAEKIIIDHQGQLTLRSREGRTEARFEIPAAASDWGEKR